MFLDVLFVLSALGRPKALRPPQKPWLHPHSDAPPCMNIKDQLFPFKTPTCQRQQFFEELEVGDWINMQYGFDRQDWCVLEKGCSWVRLGKPSWLVSSAEIVTLDRLFESDRDMWFNTGGPLYLGRGKKRWWWKFLPFRDCVFPYSKP